MTVVIGVLALQGAFIEHVRHVEKCIVENRDFYEKKLSVMTVKDKNQLAQCDALIIPGGDFTFNDLLYCSKLQNRILRRSLRIRTQPKQGNLGYLCRYDLYFTTII
ncbi:BTE_collapsed_G0044480.mRNA.1.CDS.1 [Saccharomyces cerevisiae]|nr:BTE_collapsed_G0044480.mRNA.1.CDS.1 [Saccharomyces cerevisiae]